jgi:hypothetical protein
MKKNGASHALLSPGATGWRIRVAGAQDNTVPTLDEALAAIPADAHIELALPCQSVLLERHKLPATDRAEIADMLQLQLEKTLPFPVEEMSHGYELLGQDENESTILSIAAHHVQLDQICAPLRDKGRLPERITLEAQRVAAACPVDETVLALWPEQEQLAVAIVANGKLAWAQPLTARDAETVLGELPGLLISAELEDVPVDFSTIRLSPECADLEPLLAEHFKKPIQPLPETGSNTGALDLLPASWQYEAKRRERGEKLKQNLLMVAVFYLLLIAGAFVYLAWYKKQVMNAQLKVAEMEPKYQSINQQMERWKTFMPAVDKDRYPVEVMNQLWTNWKENEKLQFTSFNYTVRPWEWVIKGETTEAARFDFISALKANLELTDNFDLDTSKYQNLKEGQITFGITGKPKFEKPLPMLKSK